MATNELKLYKFMLHIINKLDRMEEEYNSDTDSLNVCG